MGSAVCGALRAIWDARPPLRTLKDKPSVFVLLECCERHILNLFVPSAILSGLIWIALGLIWRCSGLIWRCSGLI